MRIRRSGKQFDELYPAAHGSNRRRRAHIPNDRSQRYYHDLGHPNFGVQLRHPKVVSESLQRFYLSNCLESIMPWNRLNPFDVGIRK
jgi:hypothetical protein